MVFIIVEEIQKRVIEGNVVNKRSTSDCVVNKKALKEEN